MRTASPIAPAAAPIAAQVAIVPQTNAGHAVAVADSRELQPVVAVHNLFLNNSGSPAPMALLAAIDGDNPLAWMARMQAASAPAMSEAQVIFAPQPVPINSDGHLTPRQSATGPQAPVEMAAFHFQR